MRNKTTLLVTLALLLFMAFTARAGGYNAVVAQDGSGNYTSVQAAINAAPSGLTAPYLIYIKNGVYKEVVTVPSNKPFIQLIGQSVGSVIITYNNYSGKAMPGGGTYGTSNSATVTVNATDFVAENITFANSTGDAPQAVALEAYGDRQAFKNCLFLGGQDTLLPYGDGNRQYFLNCYIDGVVDFIFGSSKALFESCVIYPKDRADLLSGSYLTAANTQATQSYGYTFKNCTITANTGVTSYVLGRPWMNDATTTPRAYNRVVFLNTTMGSSINPVGWATWDSGTLTSSIYDAEYQSKKFDGTLVDVSQRVSWSYQLSATDTATYTNAKILGTWSPCSAFPDGCTIPKPIVVANYKVAKNSTTSKITWNAAWPMAQVTYTLYRSSDKVTFSQINQQTSADAVNVNFNYSEAIPPPGSNYYYVLVASKTGNASYTATDTLVVSSTPTLTVTGSLNAFVQGVGLPSAAQSYILSGVNLPGNVSVTAPAGYEISSNNTTWNNSSTPLTLTPTSGILASTPISVRLNASAVGTYSGNLTHTCTGATTVTLPVTGTTQAAPLAVSGALITWPLTAGNVDSAAVRSAGVKASTPTFNKFVSSNGTTDVNIQPYSSTFGQAFAATPDGYWTTASGGPGGNLSRKYYQQFTVTANPTYSLRVDSVLLSSSFINTSSNTKLAVVYSLSGFASDSTDVSGGYGPAGALLSTANGAFSTPVLLANETAGTTNTYRLALGSSGVKLAAGQTLTIRLYYSCGSTSSDRYAKLKNVIIKGQSGFQPVLGDYETHQSGDWASLSTWERYDGTNWVWPAPAYPVYNNANNIYILAGHTVAVSASLTNGYGYTHLTKINAGGQLIINKGATLNVANDGTPASKTTDLQVDGTLTIQGFMGTNGNCSVVVNGTLVNTGGVNFSNGGDVVTVGSTGTWQHDTNGGVLPDATWQAGATCKVTGITSTQLGVFKNTINYGNIIWNCPLQSNYYAFRNTLGKNNVQGSFTVVNTGTTFISFANATGSVAFPGGYTQTGGTVNFIETGTVADTLAVGGDMIVTGGNFNSNAVSGTSSLQIKLTGANNALKFTPAAGVSANWNVAGSYNLGANMPLTPKGYALAVSGTLNAGTNTIKGAGDINIMAGGTFATAAAAGLDSAITVTGNKTFNAGANVTFNGIVAQTTGKSMPATVNAITVNNPADVTLSSNVTATSALNLNVGKLYLGSNTIATGAINTATAANYVVTNGTGALKINKIGNSNVLFPVGPSGTAYNPVTLNNAGTTDNFSVSVKTTFDVTPKTPAQTVNDQWTIAEDVPGNGVLSIALGWLTADQPSGFNASSPVSFINYKNSAWKESDALVAGSGVAATPFIALGSGFKDLGIFGLENSPVAPTPVVTPKVQTSATVYPNPVATQLNFLHPAAVAGAMVKIFTAQGREVYAASIGTGSVQDSFNIANLSAGMYILEYYNQNDKIAQKFIKQ